MTELSGSSLQGMTRSQLANHALQRAPRIADSQAEIHLGIESDPAPGPFNHRGNTNIASARFPTCLSAHCRRRPALFRPDQWESPRRIAEVRRDQRQIGVHLKLNPGR